MLHQPTRAVLWIDILGGYLLCLAPRISVGSRQFSTTTTATSDPQPDIPLLAPLQPVHVWLERDREGYSWQAVGPCRYAGHEMTGGVWTAGSELILLTDAGREACRLTLALPYPNSLSARLCWRSPARLATHLQSALLVSQALLLGPSRQAHVSSELLPETWLFPTSSGWLLRAQADVFFDQESIPLSKAQEGIMLPTFWHIRLGDLHLALEPCEYL
ncbi:MAG: hypothetical protein NZM42_08710 [Gemmatales bacterium]|nr:hypothetical protein [Gemmatales bacterium]